MRAREQKRGDYLHIIGTVRVYIQTLHETKILNIANSDTKNKEIHGGRAFAFMSRFRVPCFQARLVIGFVPICMV